MNNLNEYSEEQCKNICEQLPFYSQMSKDYDILSYKKTFYQENDASTPRQEYGSRTIVRPASSFSMVPFFYLEPLLSNNPKEIYDLGCGWNIFKKYIHNITGVDRSQFADINSFVDDEFVKQHQNYFESVFSINALHFRPLAHLEDIINEFISMIKPSGRGFLALNLARMYEKTNYNFTEKIASRFDKKFKKNKVYEEYIKSILDNITTVNFLIVDIDINKSLSDAMDGNIRLVIEKK